MRQTSVVEMRVRMFTLSHLLLPRGLTQPCAQSRRLTYWWLRLPMTVSSAQTTLMIRCHELPSLRAFPNLISCHLS